MPDKNETVKSDVRGLKSMASRLRAAVDTANYPRGYPEIKPSVRDSSALARDILVVVRILRELAKADAPVHVERGLLFNLPQFNVQARRAVFNSRLLASGRKEVLR